MYIRNLLMAVVVLLLWKFVTVCLASDDDDIVVLLDSLSFRRSSTMTKSGNGLNGEDSTFAPNKNQPEMMS